MRYVFLVTLMTFMMVSLITWATRPELIGDLYDRAVAPLQRYLAEKRAAEWQTAKEHAWEEWRKQIHLPSDCSQPTSSLRALECKNTLQSYADTFNRDWANKVAGGWRPEGVD